MSYALFVMVGGEGTWRWRGDLQEGTIFENLYGVYASVNYMVHGKFYLNLLELLILWFQYIVELSRNANFVKLMRLLKTVVVMVHHLLAGTLDQRLCRSCSR